jgi:Uncharacterized protein conserved in bacteria
MPNQLQGFDLVRAAMWKRRNETGLERFELLSSPDEKLFRGTILAAHEGIPVEAQYAIWCDTSWRTQRAEIHVRASGVERNLKITVDEGRWYANSQQVDEVSGSIDIDLGWTPSTNTLPIRRLDLPVGASSGIVTAAWVRFPDLSLQPLPQEYRRVTERQYLYTSKNGSFRAKLFVDEEAVVVDYENVWIRLD